MKSSLLRDRKKYYLNRVAEVLLINEGKPLKDVLALIASQINVPVETLKKFTQELAKKRLLLIVGGKYFLTFNGVFTLVSLREEEEMWRKMRN
jgi:hypothetical protein